MTGAPHTPPPGTPYLRALTLEHGALWRLSVAAAGSVAGLLILPLVAFAGVFAAAWLLGFRDYTIDLSDGVNAGEMLSLNLGLGALIGVAAFFARLLYGVRLRCLSSVKPGLRWRWLLICVAIAAAVWGLLFIAGVAGAVASRDEQVDASVWAFLAVVLMTTPLQAAGEEYVFRGLLLQGLGAARLPMSVCCAASGLLFAVAHLQFDAELFADRLLLGVALAFLTVRTGGLEAGIAIHTVKNIAVLVPTGLLGTTDAVLDPQSVSWLPLAVDAVLLAIVVPSILAAHRRRTAGNNAAPLFI